jgi:hypothetical protein
MTLVDGEEEGKARLEKGGHVYEKMRGRKQQDGWMDESRDL